MPAQTCDPKAAKRYEDLAVAMECLCVFGDGLAARLATSQVADQIRITTNKLRPDIASLIIDG